MTNHDDITRTPPALLRKARIAFVLVGVGVPLVLTAVGAALILTLLPEFPNPVATHWGPNGVDGFGPAVMYLWMLLIPGLALPALMVGMTFASFGAHWGPTARLMGAFSAGIATLGVVVSVGSLLVQRGLASPTEVPGIGGVVGLGLLGMLLVGAAAWAVQPRVRAEAGRTLEPRHIVRVRQGERVVWVGTAVMPRGALILLTAVFLGLVALAVFMISTGVDGGWIVAASTGLVGFAIVGTTAFRVLITPEGFAARSLIGWPRIRIPLHEIESVRAVDISPFGEFGGWGWRISADGRSGIVMRGGPSIEISRREKRPFIVTIDGAQEAAALLQAYVEAGATVNGSEKS